MNKIKNCFLMLSTLMSIVFTFDLKAIELPSDFYNDRESKETSMMVEGRLEEDGKSVIYFIPMRINGSNFLINNTAECKFEYKVQDKLVFNDLLNPYWGKFRIILDKSHVDDIKFSWDNAPGFFNINSCSGKGQAHLSEVYGNLWIQWEAYLEKMRKNSSTCLKHGMEYSNLPYFKSKQIGDVKYPSVYHPVAQKVLGLCVEIARQEIKQNFECKVDDDRRNTKCNHKWTLSENGKFSVIKNYKDLIVGQLSGKKIDIREWETDDAFNKYQSEIAKREADIKQRAKEQEDYQKWRNSPEGIKAEQDRIKVQEAEKKRIAKEYPYYAVLTCGMPNHINIAACFAAERYGVDTELVISNGASSKMYKAYTIRDAGREQSNGFVVDLKQNFSIKAQNSHGTLILGLTIYDRLSGKQLYQKQVAKFGVVQARN